MNFNAEAANWDNERRKKRARIIADEIINSIQIKDQCHAMEFGCGTGLISFNLIDRFERIALIDTSEGMIQTLNSKIRSQKINNMTAICGDVNDNTELQSAKFDVIYTSMALHHIIDIETTLRSLYGMLSDSGYLCIVELVEDDGAFHRLEKDFKGHNGFNQDHLKKLLEEISFKSVVTNIFYNGIKVIEGSEIHYSLFLMLGQRERLL